MATRCVPWRSHHCIFSGQAGTEPRIVFLDEPTVVELIRQPQADNSGIWIYSTAGQWHRQFCYNPLYGRSGILWSNVDHGGWRDWRHWHPTPEAGIQQLLRWTRSFHHLMRGAKDRQTDERAQMRSSAGKGQWIGSNCWPHRSSVSTETNRSEHEDFSFVRELYHVFRDERCCLGCLRMQILLICSDWPTNKNSQSSSAIIPGMMQPETPKLKWAIYSIWESPYMQIGGNHI